MADERLDEAGFARAARAGFARERRTIGFAWIALLVLMLASLGSAYLKLGPWNMPRARTAASEPLGISSAHCQ